MNTVAYVRRSKKSDAKVVSLDAQRDAITRYCQRSGLDLKEVVVHDGISGRKRERFDEIESAVQRNQTQVLAIYNLDRLARDNAGLLDYFRSLTGRGIEVHESTGGCVDFKHAMGRFMVSVRGSMDQLYAEVVAEKTSDALQWKKAQGQKYTRIAPFGYAFVEGRLIPCPEEQRARAFILGLRSSGVGARRAQHALRATGYQGRMSRSMIHRLLWCRENPTAADCDAGKSS